MIEFQEWPKIARLNRDIVITEKIDGTNAAVIIEEQDDFDLELNGRAMTYPGIGVEYLAQGVETDGKVYLVGAQSRSRLITPEADNFSFAKWVFDNAAALVDVLGPGRHFGEWWGSGIQRGYGLQKGERYFSLFNIKRWDDLAFNCEAMGLLVVPKLYQGPFSQVAVERALDALRTEGSYAQGGFMRPEGIVVYHTAANQMFKVTLENDEAPKSLAAVA